MGNVNIKRVVDNIRGSTTVYTPIVEMIVNAIQAIDETGRVDGTVAVRVQRSSQIELDSGLQDIVGIVVEDNGVGFTDAHRNSFDTLYSDFKIDEGGKGFGRFIAFKYFDDVRVSSAFRTNTGYRVRSFTMGKKSDIIVSEKTVASKATDSWSVVTLSKLRPGPTLDKKLATIARHLVERLLPYFITKGYVCPTIVLSEHDGSDPLTLNHFVENKLSAVIKEISAADSTIVLEGANGSERFSVRVFKFYAPKNQKSRISLVAHKREVSGLAMYKYIPEFEDDFYETNDSGESDYARNFIVRAYVFGEYLDRNVSLERGSFDFSTDSDLIHGIGQAAIEREAAAIAKTAMGTEIKARQEKKRERVQSYVDDQAPWHKAGLEQIDLGGLPYNPTDEQIETRLQSEKFAQERAIKKDVDVLLAKGSLADVHANVKEIVARISDTSRNDLTHYIALRRQLLDLLGKSLERDLDDNYSSEGLVHDIIFPRKGDTEKTRFEDHNLWIVDERLNFTNYVSSDVPIDGNKSERPDIVAYNKRVLFRGDNESSNPITIFEFKRPQRDDFTNPSSEEDPVQQIVRYVNNIRDGKYKTPEGRQMLVAANTPFYGYVVCDLTAKVITWLEREKDFKPMPDRQGWFQWIGNINLYVEVIGWDKVLKDAKIRNQVFFHKLGI